MAMILLYCLHHMPPSTQLSDLRRSGAAVAREGESAGQTEAASDETSRVLRDDGDGGNDSERTASSNTLNVGNKWPRRSFQSGSPACHDLVLNARHPLLCGHVSALLLCDWLKRRRGLSFDTAAINLKPTPDSFRGGSTSRIFPASHRILNLPYQHPFLARQPVSSYMLLISGPRSISICMRNIKARSPSLSLLSSLWCGVEKRHYLV